jgi:type IV pilus assembly protein PilB
MGASQRNQSKLGELLVAAGEIKPEQLATALDEQRNWGGLLGLTLIRLGIVDEHTVMRTLAEQLHLPVVQLQGKRVNAEVLELIPRETAEKHRCLPLLVNGEGADKALYLGMEDPSDPDILAEIAKQVGIKIQPVLVAQTEMDEAIERHYHSGRDCGAGSMDSKRADAQTSSEPDLSNPEFVVDAVSPSGEEATSKSSEPSLADLRQLDPKLAQSQDFAGPSPLASSGGSDKARGPSDPMLRALTQLLVEKGLITRDELVERLRTVLKPKPDS